jgi:4-pyridoxate dehydrogenase
MLSGIGDPALLKQHGVSVVAALPGVGQNLQDHVVANLNYARTIPGPFQHLMRLDRIATAMLQARLFGTGFATELPVGGMAFLRMEPQARVPDLQLILAAAPGFAAKPYLPPFTRPFDDAIAARAVLLHPESRGAVMLASSDPAAAPRILNNMLSAAADMRALKTAIRLARSILAERALASFIGAPLPPTAGSDSDADLEAFIRAEAVTFRHPLGTCRMGLRAEDGAVVDPQLRVFGTEGLRVVDASVMPDMVSGNINAAVLMIAERAADLIRGQASLPPVAL